MLVLFANQSNHKGDKLGGLFPIRKIQTDAYFLCCLIDFFDNASRSSSR